MVGYGPRPAAIATLTPALWLDDQGADAGTWSDISGFGCHAVQPTAGAQPAIVASAINGRQARRFNGSSSFMRLPVGALDYERTDSWTMLAVFKHLADEMGYIFAKTENAGNNVGYGLLLTSTGDAPTADALGIQIQNTSGDRAWRNFRWGNYQQWCMVSAVYDGTSATTGMTILRDTRVAAAGYYNYGTSISSTCRNAVQATIGSRADGGLLINMDLAEFLIFPYALTVVQRRQAERALSLKYNIR